ncbi:MAG: hypothetical protein VX640_12810 [Pseudomonadota bacterium]|nr:hypothetical protein [Pseudomonadota bacterium]
MPRKAITDHATNNAVIAVPSGILIMFVSFVIGASLREPLGSGFNLLAFIYSSPILLLYYVIGVFIGFLGAFVIGLPVHIILVRTNLDHALMYVVAGIIAGVLIVLTPTLVLDPVTNGEDWYSLASSWGLAPVAIASIFGVLHGRTRSRDSANA